MQKINESAVQVQVEEERLRREAELRIKKELIDKVAAVQLDVAKLAVEKWEENERRKLNQSEKQKIHSSPAVRCSTQHPLRSHLRILTGVNPTQPR